MAILNTVLLVLFVIVAVLLILLVLVQNEEGEGLGGVFGGGGGSTFGSRSGNILTRVSSVLGGLFLALAFVMALLTRSPQRSGVEAAGRALTTEETPGSAWWDEDAALNDSVDTLRLDEDVATDDQTGTDDAVDTATDEVLDTATGLSLDDLYEAPVSDAPADTESSEQE
jgi:preprotein translocase subunit SecG